MRRRAFVGAAPSILRAASDAPPLSLGDFGAMPHRPDDRDAAMVCLRAGIAGSRTGPRELETLPKTRRCVAFGTLGAGEVARAERPDFFLRRLARFVATIA